MNQPVAGPSWEDGAGRSIAEPVAPGRFLLRLAGLLTQLACAGCLLLGTIAFVLIQQNKSGGTGYVVAWAACAMVALVFGGLMVRGGLISLLIAALLDISFGSVLLVLDQTALAGMLRILNAEDVGMVGDILFIIALSMIGLGVLCFLSIPQAIRYGRWLHAGESGAFSRIDMRSAASTDRGFPPPPVPATGQYQLPKSSMWMVPTAPPEERKSRRRMYFALGGFAIGFGAGIGVLVSSSTRKASKDTVEIVADRGDASKTNGKGSGSTGSGSGTGSGSTTAGSGTGSGSTTSGSGAGTGSGSTTAGTGTGTGSGSTAAGSGSPGAGSGAEITKPGSGSGTESTSSAKTVQAMLQAQRSAIASGDLAGVVATLAPGVIGFGIDADEVALDKAAVEAQLERDLGDLKEGTVEIKFTHVGRDGKYAWIAEELELSAPGKPTRKLAITQLAAEGKNGWQVLAWHWAVPVPDAIAERRALLGTKPSPKAIASKLDGPKDLDAAVKDAFSSRKSFAAARSERADAFNFGSGPQERIVGGKKIKDIFSSLKAEIRLKDTSAHIVAVSPTVGVALLNADFSHKTRAMTELTITFRVGAVFVKEGSEWKLVLTQWSHGGPLR
jgi:hypothetical protein